uniref:Receptor ligand binding region domain-containing protein n=1 Tax=Romanomermis culicivorax TaxID=13658 RepID=A0A915KP82_ROMCU
MIFFLISTLVDIASSNTTPLGPLPRKGLSAFLDGDIMLGALMMVHQRENEPAICGDVMPQGGVQAVESMLYTLDYINREHIVPYTRLGALILDDCDKDTYGLQQSVEFIKGKMSNIQAGYTCTYVNSSTKYSIKPITGVVAASSSVTSIQVANLLKLFKIPQVSFFSSSAELSNRERFPYFFRTIPSDAWQVEAMKDIILEFNWSYVSLIYEESSYGKVIKYMVDNLGTLINYDGIFQELYMIWNQNYAVKYAVQSIIDYGSV